MSVANLSTCTLTRITVVLLATSIGSCAVAQQFAVEAPRTFHFPTGTIVVETTDEADHVVVKDTQGGSTAESWCDAGTYDAYHALFSDLKAALARADRVAIGKLAAYPLRVNAEKSFSIGSETALLQAYERVFTPKVLQAVQEAEPAAVFCRGGQGMLGNGVIWAAVSGGQAKVVVVNP